MMRHKKGFQLMLMIEARDRATAIKNEHYDSLHHMKRHIIHLVAYSNAFTRMHTHTCNKR